VESKSEFDDKFILPAVFKLRGWAILMLFALQGDTLHQG